MKSKFIYCFIISFLAVFLFEVQQSALASESGNAGPLNVVFLMDSSGSMKKTDPTDIRKLASQVVVSLLSPDDKIAVIEFDSEARILADWSPVSQKESILNAIDRIRSDGQFTDFRAALETADKLFIKTPAGANKVILLLTDGDFDPSPYSDRYAPYSVQYRWAIKGKNKANRAAVNREYKNTLTPVARRIIDADILPDLKNKGIQIFTVGFSPDADKRFLDYLADETSIVKTESHYFYANSPVDLMDAFIGILHFWANKIILITENGEVIPGVQKQVALDGFLKDVAFVVLAERECDFMVRAGGNYEAEEMLKGMHPNLKILNVARKAPPGQWTYGFTNGSGKYRLLLIGNSTVDMVVTGLKEKYAFGEPVRARVALKYNNQDARLYLSSASRIVAEVTNNGSKTDSVDLRNDKEGFALDYLVKTPGKVKLKFTLFAKDKQDKEMLPRPSKEFQIEVLPRFYAEPDYIKFGDLSVGKSKAHLVKVHSGLVDTINVGVRSIVKNASRCQGVSEKLPYIKSEGFTLKTGQSVEDKIILVVPEKGCWGDFEGEIVFLSDKGDSAKIGFQVHVPSIWEKLTYFAVIMMIITTVILIMLAVFWGYLKSPVGVLRPVSYPPGATALSDIKLSGVKRGIWSRWLHWRKNVVKIGSGRSDIRLSALPPKMEIELIFHRFGGDYIRNVSAKETGHVVVVRNPDVEIDIDRGPGSSYQLQSGLNIKMGGYEFVYEYIK